MVDLSFPTVQTDQDCMRSEDYCCLKCGIMQSLRYMPMIFRNLVLSFSEQKIHIYWTVRCDVTEGSNCD